MPDFIIIDNTHHLALKSSQCMQGRRKKGFRNKNAILRLSAKKEIRKSRPSHNAEIPQTRLARMQCRNG